MEINFKASKKYILPLCCFMGPYRLETLFTKMHQRFPDRTMLLCYCDALRAVWFARNDFTCRSIDLEPRRKFQFSVMILLWI